jgi:guanylate kinase
MEETTKQILTSLHASVASYSMPEDAKALIASGEVTLLCGVTASGKNTIANYLVSHGNYQHVVSHTTRLPRENHGVLEQDGSEYWFVTPEQMLDLVQKQAFIEVKAIHGDTCYGTSIEAVKVVVEAGNHPVMEIDVQGALELTEAVPTLRPLFILPPSYDVWMERLGSRGFISDGEKMRRLRSASMEIETALDHPAFLLTVNHEVELTAAEIINGIDLSSGTQAAYRQLAKDLLESIRSI